MLQVVICKQKQRKRKPNLALNKERMTFFVLQVCVNAACVPAEKFHSGCIILSVESFSLLLSHSVWDDCVCVHQRECVYVLLLCLAQNPQLSSECTLRPHIVSCFYEDATQLILSAIEKIALCQSALYHQRHTEPPHPCPVRAQNCQATRGGARLGSTVSLICQEDHCQGSAASVVHYYWRGLSDGGRLMAEQGAS